MKFLERTLLLIEERGITKNKLLTDLKISPNSFVAWESRGTIPNGETLSKIANYFNVSVDYLLGRTAPESEMLNLRIKELLSDCDNYKPFADYIGVSVGDVIRWVKGDSYSSYDKIAKISNYFGVSVNYLLGRTNDPSQPTSTNILLLTDNERDMIENYRSLDETQQKRVFDFILQLTQAKIERREISKGHIATAPDAEITPEDIKEIEDIK